MARKALLIGTKTYGEGFKSLNSALFDVQALAAVLGNNALGEFEVEVVKDLPAAELAHRMETWYLSHGRDDFGLLFVAGHGVKDSNRKLHFAATNTQKQGDQLVTSTAIAASSLSQWMLSSKAKRQVVILNCCFSGAFGDLMPMDGGVIPVEEALAAKGRAVLTSTTSMDYAFERSNSDLSVYGHYLVEGLETGAAAAIGSNLITIADLHAYVSRKVQEEAPAMVPQWFASGEAAQFWIAKVAISDPRVRYRQKVEEIVRDDGGEIDEVFSRPILVELAAKLQIDRNQAAAIEVQVLEPIQQRQEKQQKYREFFGRAVQRCYPFGEREQKRVEEYRRLLSLQDEEYNLLEEPILRGRNRNSHQQSQPESIIEVLGKGIELELIKIPPGTFLMGAPKEELGSRDNERPQHQVRVPSFYMGRYPITQAQWQAVASLPQIQRKLNTDPSRFKGVNRPVEQVSWDDAVEFCLRLSKQTKRQYRLPSEAEWEYACRAGTTTPFHFGETISTDLANYNGNYTYGNGPKGVYRGETTEVGSFGVANNFGLSDMHGNVWEWCQDHWHDSYEGAPTDGSAWQSAFAVVNRHLLRGGSWLYLPVLCRSAYRGSNYIVIDNIGFRVACGGSARTV
jgi:formylglycine-generating enzyme required for sulfatase activity